MKNLFIILFVVLFGCFNKQKVSDPVLESTCLGNTDTLKYSNNIYKIAVHLKGKEIDYFKLSNIGNSEKLQGTPELILVNGEIPEGSLRQDYNNSNDYRGYECDPAYQYMTKEIKVAFALEKDTKNRLDLMIYDSNKKSFADGGYTLVMVASTPAPSSKHVERKYNEKK